MAREQRRLAAIVSVDVAGYSRLMGRDESGTLTALKALRREVVDPKIREHSGRIVKTTGDGLLLEFASVVDAVRCVVDVQAAMVTRNADIPAERRIEFRVGVNIGDIIVEEDDIFGDGVNVAARLQELAAPGGICVSGRVEDDVRDKLDIAFEDAGEQELKNIARPVRVYGVRLGAGPSTTRLSLALPDKPSIAVLPFQNMGADPEQDYFADGLAEEIITALSRFKSLLVIARNSSFAYKGKSIDVRQVGRELGVRYLLEGSVRKAGQRVRIAGQLVEAMPGAHLWADQFDGSLADVFELQDRVATHVVGAIAPMLDNAEIERVRRKRVENLNAYDCYLRGLALSRLNTREALEQGTRLFYRAIELDPDFATPYGLIGFAFVTRQTKGWTADAGAEEAEVRRLASIVSAIGSDDALALCAAGYALCRFSDDFEAGLAMIDRGLMINRNLAFGWRARGWASVLLGQHQSALEQLALALRLSPLDPANFTTERGMASALLHLERFDEALPWAVRALAHQPSEIGSMRVAGAVSALAGRCDEAKRIMADILRLHPHMRLAGLSGNVLGLRRQEDLERLLHGLRLAGMPE